MGEIRIPSGSSASWKRQLEKNWRKHSNKVSIKRLCAKSTARIILHHVIFLAFLFFLSSHITNVFIASYLDRSTVQVKTHAQVMMRKHEQGIDIFEELDKHDSMQEGLDKIPRFAEKNDNDDVEANQPSSSFPLPKMIKNDNLRTSGTRKPRKTRVPNKSQKLGTRPYDRQHEHTFRLSNDSRIRSELVSAPSHFQPVTTTTVTTTMVGNRNHPHPYHRQDRSSCYGASHRNFNRHYYHPYQYTPSFDAIAAASAAATVAASSALFPLTQATFEHQHDISPFQVPIVAKTDQISNLSQDFDSSLQSSQGRDVELVDAEVEAIEVLLNIRAASENGHHRNNDYL